MAEAIQQSQKAKYWSDQIMQACKALESFHRGGDKVYDQYLIEEKQRVQQDKYNILYSNTETIKPSLYAQSPKVMVERTHKDRKNPNVLNGTKILESLGAYMIREVDFDYIIKNVVSDYLLPGLGTVWIRYDVSYGGELKNREGEVLKNEQGEPVHEIENEKGLVDYVYWKDVIFPVGRTWELLPWTGRRVWMNKTKFTKRFGAKIAQKVDFEQRKLDKDAKSEDKTSESLTEVFEIWDKENAKVIWYSHSYPEDLLDERPDPLKLKEFFPTPRFLRAITSPRKFTPRPFYSQYQAQATELNDITHRIRLLVDALKVVGVYDSSVEQLKTLLTPGSNRMIPVDSWAMFAEKGGIKGVVDFLPLDMIVTNLMQLYDARERVKNEIYEITGWSDIIRGVSKASETLGAQEIKSDWAGSRLKELQKEVQRFVRDVVRLLVEVAVEHFDDTTIAIMTGFDVEGLPDEQKAMASQQFKAALALVRNERERCASVDIETDSTLAADEERDQNMRMQFLTAASQALQQMVPAIQTEPRMAPLLGEMLMFTVRSFRAARPLEQTFQNFIDQMLQQPPQPQEEGQKGPSDAQVQAEAAIKQAEINQRGQAEQQRLMLEDQKERNRHAEAMEKIRIEQGTLGTKQEKNQIEWDRNDIKREEIDKDIQVDMATLDQNDRKQDAAEQAQAHGQVMAEKQVENEAAKKDDVD